MSTAARELLAHRDNVHSQWGEDGVLAEIFRRLGVSARWAVEFGAWDGPHLSNSWALLERGANGVLIEADPAKFSALRRNVEQLPGSVEALNAWVTSGPASNLGALLARTRLPEDFDLLSLDTDGPDVPIWRALEGYRPKVVVVETNAEPPNVIDISEDGSSVGGAVQVGREKGYTLVCHTGNCIFVRDDHVEQIRLDPHALGDPGVLFDPYFLGLPLRQRARFALTREGRWHLRNAVGLARLLVRDQGVSVFVHVAYHHVYVPLVPERVRDRVSAGLARLRAS